MPTYTVELSDSEQKAMEYVALDVNEWIQNAVHERARVAKIEMTTEHINTTLAAGGSVTGTQDEIVMLADLPSAKARTEAQLANLPTEGA
jgi:hypothetical protein